MVMNPNDQNIEDELPEDELPPDDALAPTPPTAPPQPEAPKPTGEVTPTLLSTGRSIWTNTSEDEYLRELRPWSKAYKVYIEMRNDAIIGAMLESIKAPIIASKFEVIAASDNEQDQWYKQFVEDNLFNNTNINWTDHVEEMLEYIEFGWALSEKVLEKRTDGRLYIKDLIPIGQDTLDRWAAPDPWGHPTGFHQTNIDGTRRYANISKLLLFTFKGRKRNPMGEPLLRSLYRPWYFKKNLETIEAIGAERDVGNAPVVKLKEGINYPPETITKLEKGLKGFRMDENLYLILPGGADITAYGGGQKVYNIREIIRDWQHIIRQRFFADFLALGSEAVGTQALAKEMTTFFSLAERSIQARMLWVWNNHLIRWLLRWNGYTPKTPPILAWAEPGKHNIQNLAQALSAFAGSNLISEEDEDVLNLVRTSLGLRPKNMEEVQQKVEEDRIKKEQEMEMKALTAAQGPPGTPPLNPEANPTNGDDNPGQVPRRNSAPWGKDDGNDKEV